MEDQVLMAFLEKYPEYNVPGQPLPGIVHKLLDFVCPHRVVIGGTYRHWKGIHYVVTGISRDAEEWGRFRVEYVQCNDVGHKASRFMDEFTGVHENGQRMFVLVA